MNGILIATMLMSGGTAVAMQNSEINASVNQTASKVMTQVRSMFKENLFETIKEDGFSCRNEEWFASLTEDQQFQINSAIDVINATYDWANMTDEEIEDALVLVRVEMNALYIELGIEAPMTQTRAQVRERIQTRRHDRKRIHGGSKWNEDFVPGSGGCGNVPSDDLEDVPTENIEDESGDSV